MAQAIHAKRNKKENVVIGKELLFDAMLYAFGVAAVSLLYKNNLLLTFVILAGWLVAVRLWHVKRDIYLFLSAAALGAAAEIIAVRFGAWQYSNPTLLGVPIWLPLLWGIAVVFIKRVADTLVKSLNGKLSK